MENSGYEAIIIGLNVFIFIIALSVSINLMSSVNELADVANDVIKMENDSMNKVENDTERIITGKELLFYNNDEYTQRQYELWVDIGGGSLRKLDVYLTGLNISNVMGWEYSLDYYRQSGGKLEYILTRI